MAFNRYLNLVLMIVDLIVAIKIFYEPRKHNPYKYWRVASYLALAACFAVLLAPPFEPYIMPMSCIGLVLIFLQMWLSFKDTGNSVNRTVDAVEAFKRRHAHKRNKK